MYHVIWEIDAPGETPREAAEWALQVQRDPNSIATVFDIYDNEGNQYRVDLEALAQEES